MYGSSAQADAIDLHAVETAPPREPAEDTTTAKNVHPDAVAMFRSAPWTRNVPIFSKSCEGFGPRMVVSLGLCYFFNKGIANNIISYSRYAMFVGRFGIDGTRYQRLAGISRMGWSLKAFSASLSDVFAIFGYTKRWYLCASSVIGGVLTVVYGLLPKKTSSADIGAGLLVLANFCMANVDIMSQGHYSRLMREHPEAGPELVSYIWWFILAATIVSAGILGPLSDKGIPQVGAYVSGACQAVTVFIFIFNFYGEKKNQYERMRDAKALHLELYHLAQARKRQETEPIEDGVMIREKDLSPEAVPKGDAAVASAHPELEQVVAVELDQTAREKADEDEEIWAVFKGSNVIPLCCGVVEFNKNVCTQNWRVLVYAAVMVCSVVCMTCVTILGTTWDLFYCAIAVAVVNCSMAFWATQPVIAKTVVFIYMHFILYVQISGATDSFYLATPACLPDGPHFNYVFYNTVAAIIGNVGGIAGVTAFTYIFSKHSYPMVFIVTTTIQVLASIFDIVIVKRWNLAIGIPDHAMYIMGDAVVFEVCYYLAWMPIIVLISRVCPRGSESMIYALVAGFAQLGSGMSGTFGSILLEKAWPIVTKGTHGECDFHNLPMLLVVSHLLLPLLIVPLSFLLLPRVRICDDIDVDGQAVNREKKRRQRECEDALSNSDAAADVPPTEPVSDRPN